MRLRRERKHFAVSIQGRDAQNLKETACFAEIKEILREGARLFECVCLATEGLGSLFCGPLSPAETKTVAPVDL